MALPAAELYYVKFRQTDNTLETYYPNALSWSDAEPIEPLMDNGKDDWEVVTATIDVQPLFQTLTGQGTIKGKIVVADNSTASTRAASGDETIYTVYLQDNASDKIIAMAETDSEGNYQFSNVPVGSYTVIPNVEGQKVKNEEPSQVAITEEKLVADVDCDMEKVEKTDLFPVEYLCGDADCSGHVNLKDIKAVVNRLLGNDPYPFSSKNANANNDEVVNVADIVAITKIILEKAE